MQSFEIGGHVGGLLFGQAQVGHIGFWLHGRGRLNPANQGLKVVLKFAGNKCAARNLIEGRTHQSLGIGYSGDHVAGAASELLDDRPSALRRTLDRDGFAGHFLPSGVARQKSARHGYQAHDQETDTHIDTRCCSGQRSFSAELLRAAGFVKFYRNHRVTSVGRNFGLAIAALFFASACFCQQGASQPPDGAQIFSHYCAKCHGDRGEGISAAVTYAGPSLQAEHNSGNVMTALEVGPEHMPRFQYVLSGDQMRAVSQYVAQKVAVIPLSGGNIPDGGELYRTYCASCHGAAVRGGALGYVGTSAPSLEGKSAALLAGAIRWGPGPMPSFPASVLSDQQLASIVDYIRVVQNPPNPGGNPLKWIGPTSEDFVAWIILLVLVVFAIWTEWGGHG
jgi:ubiquinol-cytochrome c reductase cytochrome c subunit